MTAAVMSTSGGLSRECGDKLVRQISMKLSLKRGERYSGVVGSDVAVLIGLLLLDHRPWGRW